MNENVKISLNRLKNGEEKRSKVVARTKPININEIYND